MAWLNLPVRCRLAHFKITEVLKFLIALSLGYVMRINLEETKTCPNCVCPVKTEVQTVVKPCEKNIVNSESDIKVIDRFKPRNMYEVIRYDYFNDRFVWNNFDDDPRIGLPGFYKKNLKDILKQAEGLINNEKANKWKIVDLLNGYTRYDPLRGEEYILDLKLKSTQAQGSERTETYRLELLKPFPKAKLLSSTLIDDTKTIHFVLPLAGAGKRFEMFIQSFIKVCVEKKENVELFIVLFVGDTAEKQRKAQEVSDRIKVLSTNYPNAQFKVIKTDKKFTRALGLDIAAKELPKDALLFFCDVDVTISTEFLTRCRHNAVLGKQVYYPVVFAQYDPDIVRNFSPDGKKEDLFDINKYTGSSSFSNIPICKYFGIQ